MRNATVLVVDDDQTFRNLLSDILQFEGFNVLTAADGKQGLAMLKDKEIDLMLLDLVMPEIDGIQVLQQALVIKHDLAVVMVSGEGTIQRAVEAVKMGAHDFVEKPLDAQRALLTVRNTLEAKFLKHQQEQSVEDRVAQYGMIGESPAMKGLFTLIDTLGPTESPVIITGESGVGKELVAQAIHKQSHRTEKPFVQINCAAIPETLIETELFGHEKGAFTDARTTKNGVFQQAHGGTLFLDEIGDLSLNAQAKILVAIETGKVNRVGSEKTEIVNVRIITATNRDLQEMVRNKQFREDLYFRINVIPVHILPLRKRKDDILPLAKFFLDEVCKRNNLPAKHLLPDAQVILRNRPWEGNIRELKNFMEKLAILVEPVQVNSRIIQSLLGFSHLHLEKSTPETLREAREAFERSYIQMVIEENDGVMTKAAESLGIERTHLYRKMEALKMPKMSKMSKNA